MDPRRVLTFRTVARERSFSRAARLLSLSQPSVSNQVAALERELGVRLLDRGPGGIQLTRGGAILLEHADAVTDRFSLAAAQLNELRRTEPVRLRVGSFPSALAGFVPAAIGRLRAVHPQVGVTIEEAPSEALPARVQRGDLHLAVTFQDITAERRLHDGTRRYELLRESFLVALPPDHRLATHPRVRIEDLADDDWTAAIADGIVVRTCREAGFEPHLVSLTSDQLTIRSLVNRGLAVTLAPELLIDAFDGVALRPIEGPAPCRDVYALLPAGATHPLAQAMLEALNETASNLARTTARAPA